MMLGAFQSCQLRLEVSASRQKIQEALTSPAQLQRWMVPLQLEVGLPDPLTLDLTYKSQCLGLVIQHQVIGVGDSHLKLILRGAIEGFHYWHWGEGWVQSDLEGISLLPLQLLHSYSLLHLRFHLGQS
jgi:hypothetical protein